MVLALGDYMGANCYACIGGTNIRNEVQKLQAEAPHIVVGTPGRVFDMLSRKNICESSRGGVVFWDPGWDGLSGPVGGGGGVSAV